MAGCGTSGCDCLIRVGPGLGITGTGALDNPYMISIEGGLSEALRVQDTPSVNLTLAGSGTPADPFILSAAATIALTALSDVQDPEGGPIVGDVPVWTGTGPDGHFEFRPPPANPAGAVNSDATINGDGSLGSPLSVALASYTLGPTTGLSVYLDTAGALRATPPSSSPTDWDDIVDKPANFPTNDANFTGILSVGKGGTGQNNLANVLVGNSTLIEGRRIFTQSTTPPTSGVPLNSLWFW